MTDYQAIIDKYIPDDGSNPLLRRIYMTHANQIAGLALAINRKQSLGLDENIVKAAAMLHDIGIFATDARAIGCLGHLPYIQHGVIGGRLLRAEGADEEVARVAERHTGTGITVEDIIQQDMALPLADYCPESLLERLVCYADKFYSKSGDMKKKPLQKVRNSLIRHGSDSLRRFDEMYALFGEADEE